MTEHLTPKGREALDLSDDGRIEHIRSERWIGYGRAQMVLKKLADL